MMTGQGRPRTSWNEHPATGPLGAACWALAVALLVLAPAERAQAKDRAPAKDAATAEDGAPADGRSGGEPAAEATTMRIRIAWGGGAERLWEGTIALSRGTLSEPHPLGIEADEPGSMWLDAGRLLIRQRSPRIYDGVDVLLTAPLGAKLLVSLTAADDAQRGPQIEIPLGDLSGEFRSLQLDARDNRLLVRRTPGDQLRVRVIGKSLVFAPGETLRLEVQPHLLPVPPDTPIRLKAQLVAAADQRELWASQQPEMQANRTAAIPLEVPLPEREGVYDLNLAAAYASSWPHSVRSSLNWKRTIAERKVQVVVVDPARRAADGLAAADGRPIELSQVVEIDPVGPAWWELKGKLPQLSRLARLSKGPLGNGSFQTFPHPLGELAQLKPNSNSPDVSWEAYTLSITQPGRPHVLEVEYPSDVPQTLGLSILEPNAAGTLARIGLDSGIDVDVQPWGGSPPRWLKHRLIFWPRTTAPLLLVTNRRDYQPAVFGKIRVLAGWDHLPKAALSGASSGRLLAAQLDRPLFPANFAAAESLDAWSGRSLDDWTTFHDGGLRLVEYLEHVGYNGLMLSVLADGSTIYPSAVLEPTPRYDTGMFFDTAADPVRKDVLEMLFRLFDREGMQLIPALEFAAPLPELEAARRDTATADGIEWIGPDGSTWRQNYAARRGLAPYYNTLDPRVQEAMLGVVREVTRRYAHHRSFAGLALRLSAYGYAQLPGPEWGMDDGTIARFQRDTHQQVPGAGAGRFAARAAFLNGDDHRAAWLQWRAAELHRFYDRVRQTLTADRPAARLYLAGAEMLCGAEIEAELRPVLPPKNTLIDSLLHVGIDPRQYQEDQGLVLLRAERIVPGARLNAQAVDLEINQMPDADACFHSLPCPGSLFFHPPQEVRIPSFDQKSPFRSTYTWLVTQSVPSAARNRQRFVHSLAVMDSQVMIDGGWLLSMGQEESLADLVAIYRRLPAVRFTEVGDALGEPAAQPVTFRFASCQGRTYVYAVNDAPFAVTAGVRLEASPGCQLEALAPSRHAGALRQDADGLHWSVELGPYDLAAATLSEPAVKLANPQVSIPEAAGAALAAHIHQLGVRAAALRTPLPLRVLDNPSFQRPATAADPVPGWAVSRRLGVAVQLDKSQARGGGQSVRISSDGPVACLVSRWFDPPATGRLSMSVWLRVADAGRQPPLRLALEGKLDGRDYYRFAAIGQPQAPAQPAIPITTTWRQFIFQVDDLPLEGLSPLHVRFDLMGQGQVWIDDVQLFDLAFNQRELRALYKLITLADVTLQNGQVGDCMKLLDGYWPRFLVQHVPLAAEPPAGTIAAKAEQTPAAAEKPATTPPQTGLMDRVKNMLPEKLRF